MIAEDNSIIRRGTGSCIAAIAKIELLRNEWEGLIEMLAGIADNEKMSFRKAALLTMSYILEELDEIDGISVFNDNDVGLMLSAYIKNLDNQDVDDEVREYCLKGILNLLAAASSIFKGGNGNIIME